MRGMRALATAARRMVDGSIFLEVAFFVLRMSATNGGENGKGSGEPE